MNDPRGPVRTITAVGEVRRATAPTIGDCTPVNLSCGHVSEMNWIFQYKVGAYCRCFQCGQDEQG